MLLRPLKRRRINDEKKVIGILHLPNEILHQIFLWVDGKELHANIALVCKRFLQVSRMEGMVTKCSFDLSCGVLPTLSSNIVRLVKGRVTRIMMEKIENLLRFHPKCKLKLRCSECFHNNYTAFFPWQRKGIFQTTEFGKIVPSVEAITFTIIRSMESMHSLFDHLITFPKVHTLDMFFADDQPAWYSCVVSYRKPKSASIHAAPTLFWSKFPNLVRLYITTNYEDCVSNVHRKSDT